MSAGRPSDYSLDVVEAICERIVEGESVRSICTDETMPSAGTVFRWLTRHPEFQEQYARAKEACAEGMAEEILEIADDGTNDWMEKFASDGSNIGWTINGEAMGRSRLRVDSRKWLLSKLAPKKYGDKIQNEHSGPDGKAIPVEWTIVDP